MELGGKEVRVVALPARPSVLPHEVSQPAYPATAYTR
jgi:hypothetical protein